MLLDKFWCHADYMLPLPVLHQVQALDKIVKNSNYYRLQKNTCKVEMMSPWVMLVIVLRSLMLRVPRKSLRISRRTQDQYDRYESFPKSDRGFSGLPVTCDKLVKNLINFVKNVQKKLICRCGDIFHLLHLAQLVGKGNQ